MIRLTKTFILLVLIGSTLFYSCEKDQDHVLETFSTETETLYALALDIANQQGVVLDLTREELEYHLNNTKKKKGDGPEKLEDCCYTASQLSFFFTTCYGSSTPECLAEWDLNGDGAVNTGDLTIILANYCPSVTAVSTVWDTYHLINSMASGQLRNYTEINGEVWYINYTSDIFDEVNWYFDGVLVSNSPTHLQLEYPGATLFDVPIDCNKGAHEITMEVIVGCHSYSTTQCVKIKIDDNTVPLCTSDYCAI